MKKSLIIALLFATASFAQPGYGMPQGGGEEEEEGIVAPPGPLCFSVNPLVRATNGALWEKVCPTGFTLDSKRLVVTERNRLTTKHCLSTAPENEPCDRRFSPETTQKIMDVMQEVYDSLPATAQRKYGVE